MDHRIKEMDGLRGLAVLLVMALHIFKRANEFTEHPALLFITDLTSIGWIGVDLFFVLSGYLITSILLKAQGTEGYFRNFYARRILRIVPVYYATMLVVFVVIIPIMTPDYLPNIPKLLPYQLLYLQNWLSIKALAITTPYIWVTWSLAIEEQFYLFWPALVNFLKKETLFKFGAVYFISSSVIRAVVILGTHKLGKASNFFFFNSFSRYDELVFGGLLAIALTLPAWRAWIKKISAPLLAASTALFIILCIMDLPNLPHPTYKHIPLNVAGYTSLAFFAASLIAIFVTHPEFAIIRIIFRFPILSFAGRYSYAMYLFHLPVALILLDLLWKTELRGWKGYLIYITASYLLTTLAALISWHVLEKHMLNLKKYFEYKPAS